MLVRKKYGKFTVVPSYLNSWRVEEHPEYRVLAMHSVNYPVYEVRKNNVEVARTTREQGRSVEAALAIIEADINKETN